MSIKKFLVDVIATMAISFVATIATFGGLIVLGSGLGDWIEEKTNKLFNR